MAKSVSVGHLLTHFILLGLVNGTLRDNIELPEVKLLHVNLI